MNYLARQKVEIGVIAALHVVALVLYVAKLPSWFSGILGTVLGYFFFQACILCLVTFRADDVEEGYGSVWDYPPLVAIFSVYAGLLWWIAH